MARVFAIAQIHPLFQRLRPEPGAAPAAARSLLTRASLCVALYVSASCAAATELKSQVARAIEQHPQIRAALAQVDAARAATGMARAAYQPQIQAGISSGYSDRERNRYGQDLGQRATLTASQLLYDFGRTASRVASADAQVQSQEAIALARIDEIARSSAHTWLEVVRHQQLVEVAGAQVESLGQLTELAQSRRRAGASTRSDETQALARVAATKANVQQLRAQWHKFGAQLRLLTQSAALPTELGDAPLILVDACTNAPDANLLPAQLLARAQLEIAIQALRSARAERAPSVTVDADYNHALDHRSRAGYEDEARVTLNLKAPLYQGGSTRAATRAASFEVEASRSALAQVELTATINWEAERNLKLGYLARQRTLAVRTEQIRITRDLYRQQYMDLGTRTLLELLNAEQEYHQAQLDELNNQFEGYKTAIDCAYHSGHLRDLLDLATPDRRAGAAS